MEQNSGVTFHEAQVALTRQWIEGDLLTNQKEVQIALPQATKEMLKVTKETEAKIVSVPIPASSEEARSVVARFESGADNLRGDENVSDNVAQHMLNDSTSLESEMWMGTEEEELNWCVLLS